MVEAVMVDSWYWCCVYVDVDGGGGDGWWLILVLLLTVVIVVDDLLDTAVDIDVDVDGGGTSDGWCMSTFKKPEKIVHFTCIGFQLKIPFSENLIAKKSKKSQKTAKNDTSGYFSTWFDNKQKRAGLDLVQIELKSSAFTKSTFLPVAILIES